MLEPRRPSKEGTTSRCCRRDLWWRIRALCPSATTLLSRVLLREWARERDVDQIRSPTRYGIMYRERGRGEISRDDIRYDESRDRVVHKHSMMIRLHEIRHEVLREREHTESPVVFWIRGVVYRLLSSRACRVFFFQSKQVLIKNKNYVSHFRNRKVTFMNSNPI